MTTSKSSNETAASEQLNNNTECCMCGDLGFSDQLFHCKVCQFRSQHRYCSNLYPKDEACETCNWCLSQIENTKEKSPNSSNSSSSHHRNNDEGNKNKKLIKKLQIQKPMIKKPKSPSDHQSSRSPPPPSPSLSVMTPTRKRIVTNRALEERLRRTKSEGVIAAVRNGGATKQVFRNKVRRYKLLDEVSS